MLLKGLLEIRGSMEPPGSAPVIISKNVNKKYIEIFILKKVLKQAGVVHDIKSLQDHY